MVAVGVPALRIAEGASSQVRPILQDVALALTTILNGASTQTASQILTLAGSRDANLNAQLAPLISLVSAVESKYLLPLAGTSAYGYVSIRVAQSLQTMVTGALATSP